jgi:citrate lyase beta subunit
LKSWLFTPATKADRFGRAAEVHADALIIDLEDAVTLSDKQKARTAALQYLEQPAEGTVVFSTFPARGSFAARRGMARVLRLTEIASESVK